MKLAVVGAALAVALAAGTAQAQCQGFKTQPLQQSFTLTPAQVMALGGVTTTITGQAADASGNLLSGALPSHKLVVTPGTRVNFNWTSSNAVSAVNWFTINNGSPQNRQNAALNSSAGYWLLQSSEIGNTYALYFSATDANGNTTQDRVSVSVVAGTGPSIVYQDGLPTNYYAQVNLSFTAPSMMKGCTICTQDPGYCNNVHHTPYFSGLLTNHVSGEQQTITKQQAGAVVNQNTALSGSGSIWISWLPGDTVDGTVEGSVDCSVLGAGIYDSTIPEPMARLETAIVRVSWNPSTHATQPYCSQRSSPPDYKGPIYVPTDWRDPITGQGPAGFQDWEAIGGSIIINGQADLWAFPPTYGEASGRNVPGTYPPVLPDCTNYNANIFPPTFPF